METTIGYVTGCSNVLQLVLPTLRKSLSEEEGEENERLKGVHLNIHDRGAMTRREEKVLDVSWWRVRHQLGIASVRGPWPRVAEATTGPQPVTITPPLARRRTHPHPLRIRPSKQKTLFSLPLSLSLLISL